MSEKQKLIKHGSRRHTDTAPEQYSSVFGQPEKKIQWLLYNPILKLFTFKCRNILLFYTITVSVTRRFTRGVLVESRVVHHFSLLCFVLFVFVLCRIG